MRCLAVLFILLLFCSCRTQYIPVETVKTEYRTRDSIRHDSIYQKDSVYLFVKGDTVYKEKYRYLYRYLTVNKTDTVIERDSVQVPFPVEKKLTGWQRLKMEMGGWSIAIAVLLSIVITVKMKGGK